jgi:hypothetical protein
MLRILNIKVNISDKLPFKKLLRYNQTDKLSS